MWPVMNSSALIGVIYFSKKNPLQDLLSSVNAVISTKERIEIITGHMTYNNPNLTDDNHLKKSSVFATATNQLYIAIYGNLYLH